MKLCDCIADYLNHIRHERGLAKTTCLHYQCWLRHFIDWLTENGYPDHDLETVFTLPVLRRYQYAKAKSGIRPRTIHSAFHSVRGLGEFLVANGLIETNPVKLLTLPKKDAAQRLTVTDEQVRQLFDACNLLPKQRQVAPSRAVLAILCYGALRRAEVCDLYVEDVNLQNRSVLVRSGKGSKSRRVFVCQDALNALQEWLALREEDCKHPYLFAIDRARRLHDAGIASLVETVKAAAGLKGNDAVKPHSLRHWGATNLLRNGANLRDVQQFLGHSSIEVTAQYLHSDEQQLRRISELTAIRSVEPPTPATPPSKPTSRFSVRRLSR